MSANSKSASWRGPGLYIGLMLASIGLVAGLAMAGAIEGPIVILLMILPAAFLIPLARSGQKLERSKGTYSSAARRYTWRMMAASMAYVLGLGIAVAVHERFEPEPAITFLITLLPTIPAWGMIAAMVRYIVEETDEYLRHRATMASLIGLGFVLTLGSFWGFLETFGVVINIWAWWVVPVWAGGMGIGQLWMSWRDRSANGDDDAN